MITAASAQDTNGGQDVVSLLAARHPTVTAGRVDGGCETGFLEHAAEAGISFAVIPKTRTRKGSPRCPADGRSSAPSANLARHPRRNRRTNTGVAQTPS